MGLFPFLRKKNAQPSGNASNTIQTALSIEIRHIEAIQGISPDGRILDYWRTLHPLLKGMYINHVAPQYRQESDISREDAEQVFHFWGFPCTYIYGAAVTTTQQVLMDRYDHRRDELWAACVEAEKTIDRIRKDTQTKKEKAISNYAEHLKLIPTPIAKKACHELARRGFTVPRHGVQGPYSPIKMIGWADYRHNDSWMDQGVAFQIDPDCFESDEPVIYYQDDDSWPGSGDICEKKLELVRLYSSGIGNVRAEDRIVKDWYGQTAQRRTLVFELAPAKVKTSISLSGKDVSTAETGPYVFVLPRAGEFYCTIGEIVGENAYTLHRDDFCMK